MYSAATMRSFSLMLCACVSLEVVGEAMERSTLEAIPTGKSISVAALSGFDFTSVCVLLPNQDKLSTGQADADRVNAYLDSIEYASNESHWAFVLISRTAIEVVSFKRSAQLDIMGHAEIDRSTAVKKDKLPAGFMTSDCADDTSADTRAALTRFTYQDRSYITLGKAPSLEDGVSNPI